MKIIAKSRKQWILSYAQTLAKIQKVLVKTLHMEVAERAYELEHAKPKKEKAKSKESR